MREPRREERAAHAEARRRRVQPLRAGRSRRRRARRRVEAGDPERHGGAEHPRLPRQVAGDRDPGADRREAVDGAEPEVAEPREALQVRVDDEADDRDRPQPAHDRVELPDGDEEERERGERRRRPPAATESWPLGSSRPAVRGLRASIPASIRRLSAIASDRAPTIASVIQRRSCALGDAVDREERADVGERQREDRVLDLDEPREPRGSGAGAAWPSCLLVGRRARRRAARARARAQAGAPRTRRGSRRSSPAG